MFTLPRVFLLLYGAQKMTYLKSFHSFQYNLNISVCTSVIHLLCSIEVLVWYNMSLRKL